MGHKRPNRDKKPKDRKLKSSLFHIIRRLFEQHPDALLNYKQVCSLLHIKEGEARKLVVSILSDLNKEGFLKQQGHATYKYSNEQETVEGELELTLRGSGFVNVGKNEKDIYIPPQSIGQAIHGDVVKVVITRNGGERREGRIIEVVSRERSQFVGTIQVRDKFAVLLPDNSKTGVEVLIPKESLNGAKTGDKALVKITVWPKSSEHPFGEVIQNLGGKSLHDQEMISILVSQGLEIAFDNAVMSEAEQVTMELDPEEVARRRDFRDVLTFTIDPVDAKDFDDALSLKQLENGRWEVGVHIADVSHYVRPDSAMDKEALRRGNSVYLVDRVIPMLPEQLSNMVCSLRPHEDKFTFSAVFEMDENGKVYKEWFGKTVIHSDHRFAYEDAQAIIEATSDGPHKEAVLLLDKIAKILRKERFRKGALMINSEEIRFQLDERREPIGVVVKVSKDANQLIEEFMLLANKRVAAFIGEPKKGKDIIPFVYRVHDKPDPEKIALFSLFIDHFGYQLEFSSPEQAARSINKLLDDIRLKNEYSIIQQMAIRSMAKATYETTNIGHYGLAFEYYTHFTSPIRRYADLMVHRILLEELEKQPHRYNAVLDDVCKRISRQERKATEAERESNKYFQVVFVHDKIGETFDGVVTGVTEYGLFVRMTENACEGLVPLQEIPGDRFSFDTKRYVIVGQKTGKIYNFGDNVKVRISEVHPKKRQIDLELV